MNHTTNKQDNDGIRKQGNHPTAEQLPPREEEDDTNNSQLSAAAAASAAAPSNRKRPHADIFVIGTSGDNYPHTDNDDDDNNNDDDNTNPKNQIDKAQKIAIRRERNRLWMRRWRAEQKGKAVILEGKHHPMAIHVKNNDVPGTDTAATAADVTTKKKAVTTAAAGSTGRRARTAKATTTVAPQSGNDPAVRVLQNQKAYLQGQLDLLSTDRSQLQAQNFELRLENERIKAENALLKKENETLKASLADSLDV